MEDQNKFDNYIKKVLGEEWPLPDDLQWDQMDIEIPEPKKKRRFFLWIPMLAGLGMLALIFLLWNKKETANSAAELKQVETVSGNPEIETPSAITSTPIEETSTALAQNSTSLENFSQTTPASSFDFSATENHSLKQSSAINWSSNSISKKSENNFATSRPEELNSKDGKSGGQFFSKPSTPILLSPIAFLDQLPIKPLASLPFSFTPEVTGFSDVKINEEKVNTGISLALLAGANSYQLVINADSPLANKQESAYGNSFALHLQKKLKNNFALFLGFGYDELHSTFEHHREIGTKTDFARRVKVITCETIFHNNFTKVGTLSLGVNRQLNIGRRFQIDLGAFASPAYVLGATGKTLEGEEVIDLSSRTLDKRLFFSLGLNTGMTFKIHERIHLTTQYQYTRFIGNGLILDTGVSAKGVQRLRAGLILRW